jgi:hypothetical protein
VALADTPVVGVHIQDLVGFYNRPVDGCLTSGPKSNLIDYALDRCVTIICHPLHRPYAYLSYLTGRGVCVHRCAEVGHVPTIFLYHFRSDHVGGIGDFEQTLTAA